MNALAFLFSLLLMTTGLSGWGLGYVMAHNEMARECERLGGFFVGPKVYSCQIKGGQI